MLLKVYGYNIFPLVELFYIRHGDDLIRRVYQTQFRTGCQTNYRALYSPQNREDDAPRAINRQSLEQNRYETPSTYRNRRFFSMSKGTTILISRDF